MSMYEAARSLKAQEQQRKIMAKNGLCLDSSEDNSVVEKIRRLAKRNKEN